MTTKPKVGEKVMARFYYLVNRAIYLMEVSTFHIGLGELSRWLTQRRRDVDIASLSKEELEVYKKLRNAK